jgi:hypothetical protein
MQVFALLEVSTSVLPDGRCRAREWYSCAEVCASGKQTAGEQRFALVYSHQKNHTLPSKGWVQVRCRSMVWCAVAQRNSNVRMWFDLMRGFQVDVRQGIYKGRSYVQVVDEEAMADKAFKILRCDQASCGFPLYLPLTTNLLLPRLPL